MPRASGTALQPLRWLEGPLDYWSHASFVADPNIPPAAVESAAAPASSAVVAPTGSSHASGSLDEDAAEEWDLGQLEE
jgi:hypothetical protein